jgi:hypothetical protein
LVKVVVLTTPLFQTIEYGGVPPVIIKDTDPSKLVGVDGFTTSHSTPKGNKVIGSHSFLNNGRDVGLGVGVKNGVLVGVGVTLEVGDRVGVTLGVGVLVLLGVGVGVGVPHGTPPLQESQFINCGNT